MKLWRNLQIPVAAIVFSTLLCSILASSESTPSTNKMVPKPLPHQPSALEYFDEDAPVAGGTPTAGELERLKLEEAKLAEMLAAVRTQKVAVLRSRPLTIGVIGFGRFGQFIGRSFAKYGRVVGTSRSDYTQQAREMGAKYIPLSDMGAFLDEDLDVIVVAVSITSFEKTIQDLVPHIRERMERQGASGTTPTCPLIVDVLSVKEHPRTLLLDLLPKECDVLCTHPMFGPDSAKHSWQGTKFVFERTRVDGVQLGPSKSKPLRGDNYDSDESESFVDEEGVVHSVHENSESHVEGMDRMERFLSIWEEEGCQMISMSCIDHDRNSANSQFITHLMGRILDQQGLEATPIDTKGFQSVLKLVETTSADSFDLFYGLYKYNRHSNDTILKLKEAMDDVLGRLLKEGSGELEHAHQNSKL